MKRSILEFKHVTCATPGHEMMLRDVSFTLFEGEFAAIAGADGSGKLNILRLLGGGKRRLIAGEVLLAGEPYTPEDVRDAQRARVFATTNNTHLIGGLAIYENLALSHANTRPFALVNERLIVDEAQRALDHFGVALDARAKVSTLTDVEKCVVELIKGWMLGARVFAVLFVSAENTPEESAMFLNVVHRMKADGMTVLLLVNQSIDLLRDADRLFLLSRQGRIARECARGSFAERDISAYLAGGAPAPAHVKVEARAGAPVLSVKNLSAGGIENVSFSVCAGQVLGLHQARGTRGDGVPLALAGAARYAGEIWMDGKPVAIRSERDAVRRGIALIPSDLRKLYFPDLSVEENIARPFFERMGGRLGIIPKHRRRVIEEDGRRAMGALREKYPVSGYNDLIFPVLARFMLYPYRVIVLISPSRMNDALKTEMLYNLIEQAARRGAALIVASTRRDELEAICSSIYTLE